MTKEQIRNLAERCYRLPNGKVFVSSYLIKRYSEITHKYPPNAEIRKIIVGYFEEYEKELSDVDFTI